MARAFHFSLQKVLDVRRHREEQRTIELGKANRKLQHDQNELEQLTTEKEVHLENDGEESAEQPNLNTLKINGSYLRQLSEHIDAQEMRVLQSRKETEKHREKLIEAVKKKKIVEKLRERKMEEYKKEVQHEEQKSDNEAAIRMTNQKIRKSIK